MRKNKVQNAEGVKTINVIVTTYIINSTLSKQGPNVFWKLHPLVMNGFSTQTKFMTILPTLKQISIVQNVFVMDE